MPRSTARRAAAALLVSAGAASAQTVVFDSNGFEGYAPGALDGQSGWVGTAPGGTGVAPQVVTAAGGPVQGARAVRLEIPDLEIAQSLMELPVADLIAAGHTKVTVEFDIYRLQSVWVSNLWWYWADAGNPTFGIQWDLAASGLSRTFPFEFEATMNEPTVFGAWATLSMTWDLAGGQATATYNGVPIGPFAIQGITSLTVWGILLSHDEATGSGPEIAWIDNFRITAEGGDCYPDCNQDGGLTVADFGCFQTQFVQGTIYADCNEDGQRTVADFGCFQTRFVTGCP